MNSRDEGASPSLRVLGIDPGTVACGYGIIEAAENRRIIPVACGVWKLGGQRSLVTRLGILSVELHRIIEKHTPTHVCLEAAFVSKNVRSALLLGHARGVVMAKCHELGLSVKEMAPTEAKKAVTGRGRAEKADVARALKALLDLGGATDLPLDASDALGLSYALLTQLQFSARCSGGEQSGLSSKWAKSSGTI